MLLLCCCWQRPAPPPPPPALPPPGSAHLPSTGKGNSARGVAVPSFSISFSSSSFFFLFYLYLRLTGVFLFSSDPTTLFSPGFLLFFSVLPSFFFFLGASFGEDGFRCWAWPLLPVSTLPELGCWTFVFPFGFLSAATLTKCGPSFRFFLHTYRFSSYRRTVRPSESGRMNGAAPLIHWRRRPMVRALETGSNHETTTSTSTRRLFRHAPRPLRLLLLADDRRWPAQKRKKNNNVARFPFRP